MMGKLNNKSGAKKKPVKKDAPQKAAKKAGAK